MSTLNAHPSRPFLFLMDSQMLGIGTGFDTRGAGKIHVFWPKFNTGEEFIIPDSWEGWVQSVEMLLDSFFLPNWSLPKFWYDLIREAGVPLKTFGGLSSGPGPLKELH